MRRKSYLQFAIVQEDTAELLTEKLNQKLYELRDNNPSVTFEGLTARIRYQLEEVQQEPGRGGAAKDKLNLKCGDCPMFEPVRKRDGTADRRTTFGFCPYAKEGQTVRPAAACDKLYEMVNDREVRLCFKEEQ